jgi:amino acid adenylation domain-containing protein
MSRANGNGNMTITTSATSLSEHEHQSLIIEYNNSAALYPANKTIVELFEAQVARTPNDEAVRLGDRSLSYGQLNERANQMAAHLRTLGTGPERLVTLYMEHSIEVLCTILGVLKAGAAYVPVDPATTPEERLAFILQDISQGTAAGGASPVLVTHSRLVSSIPQDAAEVVVLDSDFAQIEQYPASNPQPAASPRNLAYVIYTSGSTGKPKGVLIEHRSLVNYIWWANQKYCRGERLTWPLFSALSFDLTVTSTFAPLISGGRIVVYGEDPGMHGMAVRKVFEDGAVDIVKLTPSHLAMIKDMNLGATRIRKLIVGGEDFKTELARDITKKFGRPVEIYNEYGPTEATVGCMIHCYDVNEDRGLSVPIGIPAANAGVYILNEHLCPVLTGVTGEMYLAGEGLARGYLSRSELTEQKFLTAKDPRQNGPAAQSSFSKPQFLRLYKTGDLARWSADGRIEFLGRADYQVKIGGIRIELGEIEARLQAHPEVRECVVEVFHSGAVKVPKDLIHPTSWDMPLEQKTHSEAMKELEDEIDQGSFNDLMAQIGYTEVPPADETVIDRLVAYYVSEKPLTVAEVRAFLAKELPDYMVPPYVVRLEKLPLTPNGKIDRKALPIPTYECMQPPNGFVRPQTETEKALALIWTELLKVERIGLHDDLFDLGSHSLLGIWAVSRIQEEFGVDIPFQTLFENPTIFGLANALNAIKGSGT